MCTSELTLKPRTCSLPATAQAGIVVRPWGRGRKPQDRGPGASLRLHPLLYCAVWLFQLVQWEFGLPASLKAAGPAGAKAHGRTLRTCSQRRHRGLDWVKKEICEFPDGVKIKIAFAPHKFLYLWDGMSPSRSSDRYARGARHLHTRCKVVEH